MSLEIAFQNNRLRIVAGAAQTGGAFTIIEDVDELCYVLEGELTVVVGEETIAAGPGQMVWKPHGIPHQFLVKGPSPARFIEVSTPAGIERYFEEAAALMSGSLMPDPAALIALMRRHGMKPAPKGKA